MSSVRQIAKTVIGTVAYADLSYHYARLRGSSDIGREYDYHTRRIMARVLGSAAACVDVGCHTGEVLDWMMHYAPRGTFWAFEPISDLCSGVQARLVQSANVQLFNLALSNEVSTVEFSHIISNPHFSGFKQRDTGKREESQTIKVKTDTLDRLLGNRTIDFIKIDVEGAEMQVLLGAQDIIRRSKPVIVFEHGLDSLNLYGTAPRTLYTLLADSGLQISLLHGFLQSRAPLSREEFEGVVMHQRHFYFVAHPPRHD